MKGNLSAEAVAKMQVQGMKYSSDLPCPPEITKSASSCAIT
jgi:hypothetical protein